ncbi:MAG: hypothetical protein KY455_12820 [Euryarchaeota archaeon]|nr:hypothetical protein [Euryarchaeota archaeon]
MPADNKRPSAPSPAAAHGDAAPVDERLEPLEEFRGRSESWMKEITAQVARLASRNEDDERRKKGLDKRLGDIEQRIQSLLTLTEMLSMGSNPFVASADTRPQEAPQPPAIPQARPAAETLTAPSATPQEEQAPVPPANEAQPAPTPSGDGDVSPAQAGQADAALPPGEEGVDDEGPLDVKEVLSVAPKGAGTEPAKKGDPLQDEPAEKSTPTAGPPKPSSSSYFSDLLTKPASPSPPTRLPRELPPPPVAPTKEPTRATPQGTAERLVLLEWAELLATRLPRGKIHDFLTRYEEAGWIDGATVSRVGALATGFQQESPDMPDVAGLHDLHVRSLVLLSFFEGAPIAQSEALDVLNEARQLAHGDWATNALR